MDDILSQVTKKETKPPNPNASKPTYIRTFQLTFNHLPAGPPSPSQPHTNPLTLSIAVSLEINPDPSARPPTQGRYFLIHPEEIDLDEALHPVFQEISVLIPDAPIESPNADSRHPFWFNVALKDGQDTLMQLLDAGIIEFVHPIRTHRMGGDSPSPQKDEIEYPLVQITLSDKELGKKCSACGIWEQRTDKERLGVCSRCRRAYWCDDECQMAGWKRGEPIPHKKLCRKPIGSTTILEGVAT